MKMTGLAAALAVLVAGCSEYPDRSTINKGVNWALSGDIQWNDQSHNLFDSYKLTNEYSEGSGQAKRYIFDFTAQCRVVRTMTSHVVGTGEVIPGRYVQSLGNAERQLVALTGSFTATRKGSKWYYSDTVR